jgi:hypothetical protein
MADLGTVALGWPKSTEDNLGTVCWALPEVDCSGSLINGLANKNA